MFAIHRYEMKLNAMSKQQNEIVGSKYSFKGKVQHFLFASISLLLFEVEAQKALECCKAESVGLKKEVTK
jgi:hypothetical protein